MIRMGDVSDFFTDLFGGDAGEVHDFQDHHQIEWDPGSGAAVPIAQPNGQISPADQIRADALNLRQLGYDTPITGDAYDSGFKAAVRKFQTDHKVYPVDGLIGPDTRVAIQRALSQRPATPMTPVQPQVSPSSPSMPGTPPPAVVPAAKSGLPVLPLVLGGVALVAGAAFLATRKKGRAP